jgi:ribosomal protein L11 methylase PrmA
MPYQSFDIVGDSNSALKYKSLNLDNILIMGKSCIDIGCNEGYFCHKMIELGASNCVGLDNNKSTIDKANERIKINKYNIKYLHVNIDDYSTSDKYDIVLVSSALHYMDASKIIPKIAGLLNNDGVFIFEGGVLMDRIDNEWVKIKRSRDIVVHPTREAFEILTSKFFKRVSLIGPSVFQPGDPINRYVYHCYL